jgi:hypothetical protein
MFESSLPKKLVAAGLLAAGGGAYQMLYASENCGGETGYACNNLCNQWFGVEATSCAQEGGLVACGCGVYGQVYCTAFFEDCWL